MCQLLGLDCVTPTDANFGFTGFHRRRVSPKEPKVFMNDLTLNA